MQLLLEKWIFSKFWESTVVHDSYYCRCFSLSPSSIIQNKIVLPFFQFWAFGRGSSNGISSEKKSRHHSFFFYNKMNWGQAWFIVGTKLSNLALHHYLWHRIFFESWGRGFEMKSKFAMMLCLFFSDLGKTKQKPETSINVCSLCITFFGHQALITCWTKQDFSIVKLLNEGFRNFVGSARSEELAKPCPVECRPPDHPDWLLC